MWCILDTVGVLLLGGVCLGTVVRGAELLVALELGGAVQCLVSSFLRGWEVFPLSDCDIGFFLCGAVHYICGLGPTHEAAIADANQQSGYPDGIMTTADGEVTLRWTTYEASPALAATVEAHGGDLPWTWTRVGGARRACLPSER